MLKFVWMAMFSMVSPAFAGQGPERVTDAQAASEAKEALAVAKRLWNEGDLVCRSDDTAEIYRVSREANKLSNELDMNNLAYRARFPYYSCVHALGDIFSRMHSCLNYSTRRDVQITKQWREDIQACAAAIRKPDMSLKDLQ